MTTERDIATTRASSTTIVLDAPQAFQSSTWADGLSVAADLDPSLHSSWRIALYYIYVDFPSNEEVQEHVQFQKKLCESMGFQGRIRVSSEGVNGVLSGLFPLQQQYERQVTAKLANAINHNNKESLDLDVKYCLLRDDLSIESQLFQNLIVKETKTVISLFDQIPNAVQPIEEETSSNLSNGNNRRSNQSNRRRRRKQQRQQQKEQTGEKSLNNHNRIQQEMLEVEPAQHLSAKEWNAKLLSSSSGVSPSNSSLNSSSAILLDVRNVYESRVGYFSAPKIPTLLTNTRKYSDLPALLQSSEDIQDKQEIFMYCTGGVRCERVSQLVQTLYPEKRVYQLQGGIQTYLEDTCSLEIQNDNSPSTATPRSVNGLCLYKGKNFVFDPRRTDPIHKVGSKVGKCLICNASHDDYDNGHAPSENKEARCKTCRMLILVCNECRPKYKCWGEDRRTSCDQDNSTDRPLLYCGGLETCIHEGAAPKPELIQGEEEGIN